MRWFAGASGGHSAPPPGNSTVVWEGADPLWLVGAWPPEEVRVLTRGHGPGRIRMAVLGDCRATDAELEVGLAVARGGGLRPLTTWPGSYHVVIQLGRRTLVLGDLAGLRQVHYARYEDGVVYASHALPLADLTGAQLDRDLLAARVLCPEIPELVAGHSLFTGIDRLEGGHTLELNGAKARVRLHEQGSALLDFPAAAAALREALTAAVDRRVASSDKPGTDLSGGRDSTVLALLAARASRREVVALTWADPTAQDDVDYASRVVTSSARLRHLLVPADPEFLPYSRIADAFDAPPATDDPAAPLVTAARTRRQFEVARETGIDMHLTGYGGDAVLGTPLAYLADLAMDRHTIAALRHARVRARLAGVRPGDLVAAARRVGRTTFDQALADLAGVLDGGGVPGEPAAVPGLDALISWVAPAPATAWTTPDARHRVAAALRHLARTTADAADRPGDPAVHRRPGDRASWVAVRRAADRYRVMEQMTEGGGVRVRAPYLDNAVVRAGLALPAWARGRGDGPRTLLHTAVEGLVPRSALSRTGKGDYTRSEIRGLRRNAADLRDLFASPLLGELGILDTGAVRAALDRAARPVLGKGENNGDSGELLGGFADIVATELWLRGVAAGRAMRWGTATTAGSVIAAVA
ncbi:albusnodin/ikarugamycin family macrolactam cyclase [Yinghuangia sp. ASG 101]|uniref:albusnodin/ikarugamycin family macrolactam cyclase n=1 Tax=Yinghuangia sp. ASG 101 TaxID=2896848 RepID=UPI001E30F6AB|nr:albusnodin/ikarugamycin family macrolactam cyclase [Yinghuangia sp. ASG 101]UGQ14944.1 albusnodin/ikarugamycin family macrolactam cyclase [Yinghuangia sp. ASG 101]